MKTLLQTIASRYTRRGAWFPQRDGPKTGVIGVPLEDSGAALASKRCASCGHWTAAEAVRCDRCGRLFRSRDAALQLRRGLEQTDSLPDPPPFLPPRPAPQPKWKEELRERLAGYRDRVEDLPDPPPIEPAAELPPPRNAAAPVERLRPSRPPRLPQPRRAAETPQALPAVPPPIVDLRPSGEVERSGPEPTRPAPLSARAIAGAMDLGVALVATGLFAGILLQVEQVTLSPTEMTRVVLAAFLLNLAFYLFSFLLYAGRTAGMSWLGLSVLNLDGQPPSAAQRRSRALGVLLSLAALGIGFVWAAADEQGLTWHDRMSKTFVSQDDL